MASPPWHSLAATCKFSLSPYVPPCSWGETPPRPGGTLHTPSPSAPATLGTLRDTYPMWAPPKRCLGIMGLMVPAHSV